jgi:hypothetical protein
MSLLRINHSPSRKQLLVFAAAWLVFVGFAAITVWRKDWPRTADFLGGLAIGLPLAGLFLPRLLRHVYVGLSYATYPIGFVVSHLVLGVVYYGVLTPIGRIMRLAGYDPLGRRFDRTATTYWLPRPNPKSPGSYFRQT